MPLIDHFTLIAPYYDRVMKPPDPERMRKLAGLPTDGRLLDLGGGTGLISYPLRNWVGEVVVADSSFGMLAQARLKSGLKTVCSYAEQLSFPSASFERLIMVDALHHVRDYRATIEEMWRVVKPGGRIVIEEPDIHMWPTKLMAVMEKLILMRSHFVSPQAIKETFNDAQASVRIESEGSTSWIIIDKPR